MKQFLTSFNSVICRPWYTLNSKFIPRKRNIKVEIDYCIMLHLISSMMRYEPFPHFYILPMSGLGSVFEIANVLLLHVFLYRS